MKCRKCGFENSRESRFCEECGAQLPVMRREERESADETEVLAQGIIEPDAPPITEQRFCPSCGFANNATAAYCGRCGNPMFISGGNGQEMYGGAYGGAYEEEGSGSGLVRMILIGGGIGLAVMALVFAVIMFLGNRDDDEDLQAQTQTQTQAATTAPAGYGDGDYGSGSYGEEGNEPTERITQGRSYSSTGDLYAYDAPLVFPESDSVYLRESELYGLSEDEVQKAINDIYARNGLIFKESPFKEYYAAQSWYSPYSRDQEEIRSGMNSYERTNIELLSEYNRR